MKVVVFRNRVREGLMEEYGERAGQIYEMALKMPGLVSTKDFVAEDGERVTIVEFKDQDSQSAWAKQSEHVAAKRRGREAFYAEYSIQVCEVVRESRYAAPQTGRPA